MKRASVTEAKNNLSALLRDVRQGNTVLITHRGAPVARIGPCWDRGSADDTADRLVQRGLACAPGGPLDVRAVVEARLPRLPDGITASGVIAAERADER